MPHIRFYLFIAQNALSLVTFVTGITNMSFGSESITTCVNNKFQSNIFQNFSRIFKSISVKGVCFISLKELLEIGARFIQMEQVLKIGAKLLQIRAAPVVTNWGNSYYKLGQLLKIGTDLLQVGAGITN